MVSFRTNPEIMMFTEKKNYTRVTIQLLAFRRKPKKLRLFNRNKKLAIFKTRNGESGNGNGERRIFKMRKL